MNRISFPRTLSKKFTIMPSVLRKSDRIFLVEVCLLASYFSLHSFTDETNTTLADELMYNSTSIPLETIRPTPPVQLQDIGYDGTWEKFCDPKEIAKDFPLHPQDELRIMRLVLCKLWENNNISRFSLPAFVGYKYCAMMRPQAEYILDNLVAKLTHEDNEKKKDLFTKELKNQNPFCFDRAEKAFKQKCIHEENAYFRMFRPILAQACMAHWLTTEEILTHIKNVCQDKYMPGKGVDWNLILNSINYRD